MRAADLARRHAASLSEASELEAALHRAEADAEAAEAARRSAEVEKAALSRRLARAREGGREAEAGGQAMHDRLAFFGGF